jgi:hypothetical protein
MQVLFMCEQFHSLRKRKENQQRAPISLMDVKIRVCLPRKYGRFMLFIDNNLLLSGARLHILNNIYRK